MTLRRVRSRRVGYVEIAVFVAAIGAIGLSRGEALLVSKSGVPVAESASPAFSSRSAVSRTGGPGSDTLWTDERLNPGESISSGSTQLVYQADNHLVLYQGGTALWASQHNVGATPESFLMQADCNAVVYNRLQNIQTGEWTTRPAWDARTSGLGSGCYARVIEGDWFICSGTTRVWSARGGGSCDDGAGCRVTTYVNQQETIESADSLQFPFRYCSQLTGALPPECSYYCAYIGGSQNVAKLDIKVLQGNRRIRTGQGYDTCGNVNPQRVVIWDESWLTGDHCWVLNPTDCVDQYWRLPVAPRC
jgi:hypothetical protein